MKKLIATICLMGIILMSNAAAKPGIYMADFQDSGDQQPQPCSSGQTNSRMRVDWGIFVTSGFTGIFVTSGFMGIIVIDGFSKTDSKTDSKAKCRG